MEPAHALTFDAFRLEAAAGGLMAGRHGDWLAAAVVGGVALLVACAAW